MKRINEQYDLTKAMLNQIRTLNEEKEKEDSDDIIPITNDIRFGDNVLKNEIENFKKSVHSGAKFAAEHDEDNKEESNPLIFYINSGNLVFSGSIPVLSGLKFQFSLNDVTNAPYIFVDGLALTEDVISTLNKLNGYYKNWKESWLTATDLLDKLGKKNKD